MEKYKVSTVAELLGVAQKTVYRMIERGEVNICQERVNNRETTLIMLDNVQLNELTQKYKSQEGQYRVNDVDDTGNDRTITGQTYEGRADREDYFDKLQGFVLEVNDRHSQEVKEYVDRLVTAQSQALYLEDKQKGQEALYLNEINNLTRDKNMMFKVSLTVMSLMLIGLITVLSLYINKLQNPTVIEKPVIKEVIKQVPVAAKPTYVAKKTRRR